MYERPGRRTIGAQLTVLGSGSAGNATLLRDDAQSDEAVLIDAGLSYRQMARRLETIGTTPEQIGAIAITHAHGDHTRGAGMFSRKHGVPVYTTEAVRADWGEVDLAEWRPMRPGRTHDICGWQFEPLVVPHDASETVAFRIDTTNGALGFATDIGVLTAELVARFRDCRLLVLESNHSSELLEVSPYNRSTRERIGGTRGHLSNESLATFVRTGLGDSVQCIVLAHLSRVNNVPEIAEMSCRDALAACGRGDVEVVVTRQDRVAPTINLGALGPVRGLSEDGTVAPVERQRVPRLQPQLPFDVPSAAKHGEAFPPTP